MPNTQQPIIRVDNLSFNYPEEAVLKEINLEIYPGECLAILGLSGSGKSTLLNLLASLDTPTAGEIHYVFQDQEYTVDSDGLTLKKGNTTKPISRDTLRSHFGFVFQTPFMLGNFNASDNIGLPLRLRRKPVKEIHHLENEMLNAVKLQGKGNLSADQLSGGQRQRVAIGRALIHRPAVVFADEPTGNLDSATAKGVMETFLNIVIKERQNALVLVTHDPCVAAYYADRIVYLVKETPDEGSVLVHRGLEGLEDIRQHCSKAVQHFFN
ncbi:ABC transporter ATP-binding protein [Candidatus Parabeggiatoa sp. HSG14]|uniref:ABC transporter ATP-binding protein n=1 Tax=Candidatus Parabeggiatoa sp. HSG14 TaxID=3055593 RepID=UPI0025A8D114|nr:ABC transporter ATP-binding protein [Thiotrichales bacterium HSG14]